jgi:hypothetical protein
MPESTALLSAPEFRYKWTCRRRRGEELKRGVGYQKISGPVVNRGEAASFGQLRILHGFGDCEEVGAGNAVSSERPDRPAVSASIGVVGCRFRDKLHASHEMRSIFGR